MPQIKTLIANSGIQLMTMPISIDTQDKYKEWFHEWYDKDSGEWKLEAVHEVRTDDHSYFFRTIELSRMGYLANPDAELDIDEIRHDEILPLMIDDTMVDGVEGKIYSLTFNDRENKLSAYENEWMPLPYFFKRSEHRFKFGPVNWARMKMVPAGEDKGVKHYNVLFAFDTRTGYDNQENTTNERPEFPDKFRTDIDFALCDNVAFLYDFFSAGKSWSYNNQHLLRIVHPNISHISQLREGTRKKMSYVASFLHLIGYLTSRQLMPTIKLFKDQGVEVSDVDMVIDIGNSRTTALLIEDNTSFNQVRPLSLIDFTDPISVTDKGPEVHRYDEPFDMRLVFRKVTFGNFGLKDSTQFVYPSLVRLGREANALIHRASSHDNTVDSLSTYSSPKRYLWDWRPNPEEWRFMVLDNDKAADTERILDVPGVTNLLRSDGTVDLNGSGGLSYHFSRRSLMTLSFVEMIAQANIQINSPSYRSIDQGFGHTHKPRKIKRIVVTCPTAMSRVEREALTNCARDAVQIMRKFNGWTNNIEVIPSMQPHNSDETEWYYDEATCSQLVYMYGEVGNKYKGCCSEFFNLYGKDDDGSGKPSLTVGSLDIGAGTSDLMISRYTYQTGDITKITPEPLFYDSYYFAGDDMLHGLIKNIMLLGEDGAFRHSLSGLDSRAYRQTIKDFFGPDHNSQTLADRILRKDFNIQYSVPLMHHFLELVKTGHKDCVVRYADVFGENPPARSVIEGFRKKTGIDITALEWRFNNEAVSAIIEKEFEPLLKRIATIMHAYACDIVLLSGRPASLPSIRDIFLKYYAVSPDRLIMLNNYYVGDWYPFDNNTGYITNPKTIVAMGGIIAHYASALSNLNNFVIDLAKLKEGLNSTVNYIESSREAMPISYCITPDQNVGELVVSRFPATLNVRQLGMDSYPGRALYSIDFNRHRLADQIRRSALLTNNNTLTDSEVQALVREHIDNLKKRMPFRLTLERDVEDKELITISAIIDNAGNDVADSAVEIHIQSLGDDERYWLDSGAFNF